MKIYTILAKTNATAPYMLRKAFKKKEDAFTEIESYAFTRGYSEVISVDTYHDSNVKVIYGSRANSELELVFNIIEVEITD